MKFQKFVKSIGSDGIVYVRENEELWLAPGMAHVKIPDEIKSTKANAQEESDKPDTEKAGKATWDIYQSYITAGFTEEQAWTLVQIVMSNATKRTLF